MKLLIHPQSSTVEPLKFGNGYVIPSHALPGMWLHIHDIKVLFQGTQYWWKSSSHTEIWQASRQYGKIDGQLSKQYEGFNIKFRGTRDFAKSYWMMSILHSVDKGPGVGSVGIARTVHLGLSKDIQNMA